MKIQTPIWALGSKLILSLISSSYTAIETLVSFNEGIRTLLLSSRSQIYVSLPPHVGFFGKTSWFEIKIGGIWKSECRPASIWNSHFFKTFLLPTFFSTTWWPYDSPLDDHTIPIQRRTRECCWWRRKRFLGGHWQNWQWCGDHWYGLVHPMLKRSAEGTTRWMWSWNLRNNKISSQ